MEASLVEFRDPGYRLEPQGLIVTRDLTEEEWAELGKFIVARVEGSTWALGDWLVEGGRSERDWFGGSTYQTAQRITGYSKAHLSSAYQTSITFPRVTRFPNLSWSVHREARRLPDKLRNAAMQKAAEGKWTMEDMSRYIDGLETKARLTLEPEAPPVVSSRSMTGRSYYQSPKVKCPNCQHEFPIKGNKK